MKKVELKDMEKGKTYGLHNSGVYQMLNIGELEIGKEYTWRDELLEWPLSDAKAEYLGEGKFKLLDNNGNVNFQVGEIIGFGMTTDFPFLTKI